MRDSSNSPDAAAPQGAKTPLFRSQAIEQISVRQYGTVLLTHPLSHKLITAWFALIGLALILFFALFQTSRKAQCQGILTPGAGVIRILPTQAGILTQAKVREGQFVKAGDVLFVLSSERSSTSTDSTQQTILNLLGSRRDSLDAELKQANVQSRQRMQAAQARATTLAGDIQRLDDQIKLQQNRIALVEQSLKRYSDLHATNYISAAQLQEKQAEVIDNRQRLADFVRLKSGMQRDLTAAEVEVADLRIQAGRESAAFKRNVAVIDQDITENEARREILIRAPHDGTVSAITAIAGQTVTSGVTLATLLPAGSELEAEVYAPSRAVGFVQPGMEVLLRYQAYPYQKFGQHRAVVSEVASAALTPQELAIPGANAQPSEPMYRIRLKLDKQAVKAYGKQIPLKSGMLVDASVVLEKRKLYEWILEPIYSISGRL